MLRQKGHKAELVLLQRSYLGEIQKQSPSPLVFSHALVGIEPAEPGQNWFFLDPTLRMVKPGVLAPHSCERPALVVRQNGPAEWLRLPRAESAKLTYEFDLKADQLGRLEGWVTVTADGYHAGQLGDELPLKPDRDSYVSLLASKLDSFNNINSVIDVKVPESWVAGQEMAVRGYVAMTGLRAEKDEPFQVWLPGYYATSININTTHQNRKAPVFLSRGTTEVIYKIEAPKTWRLQEAVSYTHLTLPTRS